MLGVIFYLIIDIFQKHIKQMLRSTNLNILQVLLQLDQEWVESTGGLDLPDAFADSGITTTKSN